MSHDNYLAEAALISQEATTKVRIGAILRKGNSIISRSSSKWERRTLGGLHVPSGHAECLTITSSRHAKKSLKSSFARYGYPRVNGDQCLL